MTTLYSNMRKVIFQSKQIFVESATLPPLPKNHIRVKHLYSLISVGTERLQLNGKIGSADKTEPGYSAVGIVIEGFENSRFDQNDVVITFGKHTEVQDFELTYAEGTFIPINPDFAKQATFCMLGAVAMHALHRVHIRAGDWVLILGLGVVGNLIAQIAAKTSLNRTLVATPGAYKRQLANSLGLRTLNPQTETFMDEIQMITQGGADVVIEASGNPNALPLALKAAAYGGQVAIVAGHYEPITLDLKSEFQNKELSLIGSRRLDLTTASSNTDKWSAGRCAREFYGLLESGEISIDPLISHCISLDEVPELYQNILSGDASICGAVIKW